MVLKLSCDIIKVLYWFFFAFGHKPARGKIAKKKVTSSLPCSWGRIKNLRPLLTVNLCVGFSDLVSDLPYDIMKAPNQKILHVWSQTGFWQVPTLQTSVPYILQFRLSCLFEKKRIRSRFLSVLRSTMTANAELGCVSGRWAELVNFYYFHIQSAAAHIMHIKVYARTSDQTNASLLFNCRPPTARVYGGQARTRRTLNWRKHEARASARAYIRSLGRPWCGFWHRQTACCAHLRHG